MTTEYITETAKAYAPWRKGISWWVVTLQGAILAGMGGFGLWRPEQAGIGISLALAALLVVQAIWIIVSAMRGREYGMSVFNLLAAGGGLVAGLGILIPYIFIDTFNQPTAWGTFGMAVLIVGVLTLASSFIERPNQGIAWATLIRGVLQALFGAYIFYVALSAGTENARLIQWLSIALLVIGLLLVVWSGILYNRNRNAREKAAAPAK